MSFPSHAGYLRRPQNGAGTTFYSESCVRDKIFNLYDVLFLLYIVQYDQGLLPGLNNWSDNLYPRPSLLPHPTWYIHQGEKSCQSEGLGGSHDIGALCHNPSAHFRLHRSFGGDAPKNILHCSF